MGQSRLIRALAMIVIAAFALTLSACDGDASDLKQQIAQLQSDNQSLQQKVQSEQATNDRLNKMYDRYQLAASEYQGCEWGFGIASDLCPVDAMTLGEQALAKSFPGGGWAYWSIITAKLTTVLLSATLAALALIWLWSHWTSPKLESVEASRKLIATAQEQANTAEGRAWRAEHRERDATRTLATIEGEIENRNLEIQELSEQLAEIEANIAKRQSDLDALGGFL